MADDIEKRREEKRGFAVVLRAAARQTATYAQSLISGRESDFFDMASVVLKSDWLAEHDAKVRAEAIREAYADLEAYTDSGAPFGHRPVEEFLLHRADRIEQGKEQGS